jgi:hypothetical protein
MRIDGKYLILRSGNWDYEIPLADLKTPEGLEKWVCHMTEKTWFSLRDAQRMIGMCQERFGYEYTGRLTY